MHAIVKVNTNNSNLEAYASASTWLLPFYKSGFEVLILEK
jgi:hypothetical protein